MNWDPATTGFPILDAADRDDPAFNIRLGAYYPSSYALFMLASPAEASAVHQALRTARRDHDARLVSPQGTADFMQQALDEGGLLAGIVASEAKQTKMLMDLALSGHAMLVIKIDDNSHRNSIVAALGGHRFPKALYYQTLAIEELPVSVDAAPGSDVYGMNERPRDDVPRH